MKNNMQQKTLVNNRAAAHEYFILETYESGIVLDGGEVKSLRNGGGNLKDAFCYIENGETYLKNAHITVYDKIGAYNVKDAKRQRKLLLNKKEINKIKSKVMEQGFTLIPLRFYLKGSLIKLELGICKGKHTYDKKQSLKEKDIKRETERQIKNY